MPAHRLWMKSGASGRAVNFYHSAVEYNGYQYGHDFHAQAHKACFHDK